MLAAYRASTGCAADAAPNPEAVHTLARRRYLARLQREHDSQEHRQWLYTRATGLKVEAGAALKYRPPPPTPPPLPHPLP